MCTTVIDERGGPMAPALSSAAQPWFLMLFDQ